MQALFWSAVLNGVIAVPMMGAMMLVASRPRQMGRFTAGPVMTVLGWVATAVMAVAVAALAVTSFR